MSKRSPSSFPDPSASQKRPVGRPPKRSRLQETVLEKARAKAHGADVIRRRSLTLSSKWANARATDNKRSRFRSYSATNNGLPTGRGHASASSVQKTVAEEQAKWEVERGVAMAALARSRELVDTLLLSSSAPSSSSSSSSSSSLSSQPSFLRTWKRGDVDRFDQFVYDNDITHDGGTLTIAKMVTWIRDYLGYNLTKRGVSVLLDFLDYEYEPTTGVAGYYYHRARNEATLNHRRRLIPFLEFITLSDDFVVMWQDETGARTYSNPVKKWTKHGDADHA